MKNFYGVETFDVFQTHANKKHHLEFILKKLEFDIENEYKKRKFL